MWPASRRTPRDASITTTSTFITDPTSSTDGVYSRLLPTCTCRTWILSKNEGTQHLNAPRVCVCHLHVAAGQLQCILQFCIDPIHAHFFTPYSQYVLMWGVGTRVLRVCCKVVPPSRFLRSCCRCCFPLRHYPWKTHYRRRTLRMRVVSDLTGDGGYMI